MQTWIHIICLHLLLHIHYNNGQTLNDSETLMNDNLMGYDRRHRPILNQSLPIIVNITFNLFSLFEVDEIEGKFAISANYKLAWKDERISWDPTMYGGIYWQPYDSNSVWYPQIAMMYPYDEPNNYIYDWVKVRMYYNGFAAIYPGGLLKSKCFFDVTYYPFDTQICSAAFVVYSNVFTELQLNSEMATVNTMWYSDNGIWTLQTTTTETGKITLSEAEVVAYVRFGFVIKRKSAFLVVTIIVPLSLLVFLNVFVFMLPMESGERVSFSVTILLAQYVFLTLIGNYLPQSSNPLSLLAFFLLVQLLNSTFMCICTIAIVRAYDNSDRVPPRWILILFGHTDSKINPLTKCKTFRSFKVSGVSNDQDESNCHETSECELDINDHPSPETKWKDIANKMDIVCGVFFLLVEIITIAFFMTVLVTNSNNIKTGDQSGDLSPGTSS